MTNADLDRRVRAIAATLGQRVPAGGRALIVCPPGLDYVASFLACLYAGVIAVPVYPPNPVLLKRTLPRLLGVIADAQPAVVLAPTSMTAMADEFTAHAPALGALPWQNIDDTDLSAAGSWRRPPTSPDDIAFLQYTSGSTGRPKGVVLSHANLLHNLAATNRLFVLDDPDTHVVIWLPPYHDMGLIGGLLNPAYGGFPVTFMSPLSFLKRPARWLRAISELGATVSGGPNFAYELCVAKVSDEDRQTLDLSSWKVAFSGAEPVRAETLDRFARAFEPCGFSRKAFLPVYGLAEGTLLVSGGDRTSEPVLRRLQTEAYRNHQAIEASGDDPALTSVGCGQTLPGQDIAIVNPDTLNRCPDGSMGEIWVSGPSITRGYWQRPQESRQALAAQIPETGEGPFLRTGDLGFLDDGELYVTGRLKDLIIIAGENHYPQDIENSVEAGQPALRPGCGAAFSVDVDGEECLVLAYELNGGPAKHDLDAVISGIRATVAEAHGLQVHDVILVRHGRVPKTSSGKLQRLACKNAFLEGRLENVATWSLPSAGPTSPGGHPANERRAAVETRLGQELARRLKVAPETLDLGQPFANYGLQSVDMVGMVGDLEVWLGRELPATLLWEYPTVELLATFLSSSTTSGQQERPEPAEQTADPVAIIGIGCRFPGGADGPETFWQSLRDGRDSITQVPADRWKAEEFLDENPAAPGKTNTRWGGFVEGIDQFDPQFFGISPREATQMDPQQRLLTEVAWEALEDAGVVADSLAGSATGVFVGIATSDYAHLQLRDLSRIDAYTGTGNAFSIAANRLSYLFDLRGPSISLDTACSSSLVAVHQACLSLAQGDCSLALAGGVNLVLSPALAINFSKAGAMAPDGRCKAFDSRADGYVRSEGAGMVVLKPLALALADHDSIYGVIRGGAVNQDGRTNGLMAPNPHAQEAVLRTAYARADVRPEQVHYVEAHGTGTLLGDPIEAQALSAVVAPGRDPGTPCLIGSVKSNIGHLEAAAGIAGLIKVALMLRHRMVPASLHYQSANPHIAFQDLGIRVASELQPWPVQDGPASAGVSAFGFGGTNAHLVVQEAPRPIGGTEAPAGSADVLLISARNEEALRDLAAKYETRLGQVADEGAAHELCAAAAVRRTHHEHRLACVASTSAELRQGLGAFARDEERPGLSWGSRRVGRHPKVAFVFSGQGPSWWPLGRDLFETEPVFREVLERCDEVLARHTDWSLIEQLFSDPAGSRLADPAVGQPAFCALQVALAALWRSWGIEPLAVVGHSVGEVAAAHVAGVLDLPDALFLALQRGLVIRAAVGGGKMAVTTLSLEQAQGILAGLGHDLISVAASNGPTSTVFSGDTAALKVLAKQLDTDGIFCRVLGSVDFASHSPQMDPLRDRLRDLVAGLQPHPGAIPMISTVTGELIDGATMGAHYWATNLRQPVLFDTAITALVESGHDTFVEISPHPMLGAAVSERISAQQAAGIVTSSLNRTVAGRRSMLAGLSQLHCAGYPVDWSKIYGTAAPMVTLPTYPWQRQRYWLEPTRADKRHTAAGGHPMLDTYLHSAAGPGTHHWCARIDLEGFPYLRDHQVGGTAVLPAALVLETALAAARKAFGQSGMIIEDVHLTRMTVVDEVTDRENLQLVLYPETGGTGSFELFSRGAGDSADPDWTQVARGRLRTEAGPGTSPEPAQGAPAHRTIAEGVPAQDGPAQDELAEGALASARGRCQEPVDCAGLYARLNDAGLAYGPSFQGVDSLWRGEDEALARLRDLAEITEDKEAYLTHPALLDSALQTLAAALDVLGSGAAGTFVPVTVGRFTLASGHPAPRWAHAVVSKAGPERLISPGSDEIGGAKVVLFDVDGCWAGEVDGITLKRLDQSGSRDPIADSLLEVRWTPATETPTAGSAPAQRADADAAAGWWLLFADRGGLCEDLRTRLHARGASCVTVTAGERYRRLSATHFEVRPCVAQDLDTLFGELENSYETPCAAVVHAWSLDASLSDSSGTEALWTAYDLCCVSVLLLVQSLTRQGAAQPSRLVLVTRGAHGVTASLSPGALADLPITAVAPGVAAPEQSAGQSVACQSALWGLARVVALEHGELRPMIVDLDPAPAGNEAAVSGLLHELLRPPGPGQVALRGGNRYLPRLGPLTAPAQGEGAHEQRLFDAGQDGNYRILATHPGILGSLAPTLWERTPPGPGQVEIEVCAAGLNFMDVLKAMDICPGVPPGTVPLGAECAGTVTAVGQGVDQHRVGDRVMAVAPSSMAAFATTSWQLVAPIPEALNDEQAAAAPIAFLTAVYGLEYLARLRKGDTVLIHSATGGVGLAALQVARRHGAQVFATAGTAEKRELLRSLGVRHPMDSRSLLFADQILELTGGRGVDVVLNSLTGEALTRSLSLLAPNGRFVEIGKQDIYHDGHLSLGMLKHNRSFLAVDLERLFAEQPDLIADLFSQVGAGFASGELSALPVTSFGYSEATAAFAHMAAARHTGKVVLRPGGDVTIAVRPGARRLKRSATYLITGGLGALGLETAQHFVDQGARHLVLLGRHAPSAAALPVLAELRSRDVEVRVVSADISRFDEVAAMLAEIDSSMPALAGIVHAAGILDDGLLLQLDPPRFRSVAESKVAGAWHLHRATLDRELDFFVLFSSAAAQLGSPGQGSYAAANAFMDSLAVQRQAQGLPALSISWGPWAEVGLAATAGRGGALSGHGILSLSPHDGMAALDMLLPTSTAHAAVLPLDLTKLREAADSGLLPSLLGDLLAPPTGQPAGAQQRSGQVRQKLMSVEPGRRRVAMLTQVCTDEAARVLKLEASRIDTTMPLASMGFDSLMSLELRKRLESRLAIELPATVVWRFPTIDALVPFVAERMGIALEADSAADPRWDGDPPPVPACDTTLEQLSDADVEALLLAKMTQINEGHRG